MIFITHDIGLASDLCDSIAVAYAGQQVEFGPADRVLVEPRHPYSRLLLSPLPRLHDPCPLPPCPANRPIYPIHPAVAVSIRAVPMPSIRAPRSCPPNTPSDDGGHARCFLNDQYLAGDRYPSTSGNTKWVGARHPDRSEAEWRALSRSPPLPTPYASPNSVGAAPCGRPSRRRSLLDFATNFRTSKVMPHPIHPRHSRHQQGRPQGAAPSNLTAILHWSRPHRDSANGPGRKRLRRLRNPQGNLQNRRGACPERRLHRNRRCRNPRARR